MRRHILLSIAALWLAGANHASANVGTPLMWATMGHLFLGNALIGLLEGLLLGRLFKVPVRSAILTMIAANYLSAWVGMIGLMEVGSKLPIDLYNARQWLWAAVAVAY